MESKQLNMEFEHVIKRDGRTERMSIDKIERRLAKLCDGLSVNLSRVTRDVASQMYDGMKTHELDELSAQICASLCTEHPDYGTLASRIIVSNHHKNTSPSFSEVIRNLYENKNIHDKHAPLVSKELYDFVMDNCDKLNSYIDYERDYNFDYFGFKTLEKSYLMRIKSYTPESSKEERMNLKGKIVERPQHLLMRVAIGIHGSALKLVLETYDLMSQKYFIHATPTLFNAGTPRPQLSSCFLLAMKEDSIDGIYSTLRDCALISKWAGGIGLHIHNVRAKNSIINGTNGISNGIVPMLRVFNNTARYVDQGGGKRNGSIAIYLEPWHADIQDFLLLRKNHGNEEERARDLFYAMWISDLFMERVKSNGDWSLFCPDESPGLPECYGDEFKELYEKYEREGRAKKTIKARELWIQILESQIETGTPYICYKDACNKKSNQKNLGTIKSSNLCTEIIEYSNSEEFAVCNLASIGLSKYVKQRPVEKTVIYTKEGCSYCKKSIQYFKENKYQYEEVKVGKEDRERIDEIKKEMKEKWDVDMKTFPQIIMDGEYIGGYDNLVTRKDKEFDFEKLLEVSKIVTRNLDKVIDVNFYPVPETKCSNMRHRPIGIGVQGLADVFAMLRMPFDSPEAAALNTRIFETIYFGALSESNQIASEKGTYETYKGSPMSQGILQFDMWEDKPEKFHYDWDLLRDKIKETGVRNSLLLAPMPTASTSQILGNNECFEPFTSNIYLRRTLAGEFVVVNRHLINDCIKLGIWNNDIKNKIIANSGSVQNIPEIPEEMKPIYKTAWELKNKVLINMAADRGRFICQSQSLNLFMEAPNFNNLSAMHMYSWKKGLKTGIYYLRTRPVTKAQQFTIEPTKKQQRNTPSPPLSSQEEEKRKVAMVCDRSNPDCEACSA